MLLVLLFSAYLKWCDGPNLREENPPKRRVLSATRLEYLHRVVGWETGPDLSLNFRFIILIFRVKMKKTKESCLVKLENEWSSNKSCPISNTLPYGKNQCFLQCYLMIKPALEPKNLRFNLKIQKKSTTKGFLLMILGGFGFLLEQNRN